MDVPRKGAAKARLIRRVIVGGIVLALAAVGSLGLSRLKPAAPAVDRSALMIDQVKRGPMLREVRGLGTLVPQEIIWLSALTDGQVQQILARPGADVAPETVVMILRNPEVELAALNAEWQVKTAKAQYEDLRARLQNLQLDQEATSARVASEFATATLNSEVEHKLGQEGLTSEVKIKTTKAIADELANRAKVEERKIGSIAESIRAQLEVQKVQIDKLTAEYGLRKRQVDDLRVRAGIHGVLQQLGVNPATPIEVGQRVTAGTILAKLAQPTKLKAELKIAETQAKDIRLGLVAQVDTRNGIVKGSVSRIDPAVQNGTVTVDVRLEGDLPAGAVPDLSVDGTIEIERLTNVLYVGRPVSAQPHSTTTLFKLDATGEEAQRASVKLGRTSVNSVEVISGLMAGDRVILSDMSAQDATDRIRLR